jgi:hypothetical protein
LPHHVQTRLFVGVHHPEHRATHAIMVDV